MLFEDRRAQRVVGLSQVFISQRNGLMMNSGHKLIVWSQDKDEDADEKVTGDPRDTAEVEGLSRRKRSQCKIGPHLVNPRSRESLERAWDHQMAGQDADGRAPDEGMMEMTDWAVIWNYGGGGMRGVPPVAMASK